jgi:hydroxypyruvate isomerase
MPRFDANLSMMFNEVDFLDRFAEAARAGFSGVEFLFPYDYAPDQILEKLRENKLTLVLHNMPPGNFDSGERGLACLPNRVGEFQDGVGKAIDYASALGCAQVHCMSGITPWGADPDLVRRTLIENMRFAAKETGKAGIKLLIEPINTRDMPGYYLSTSTDALILMDEVGSTNLWLQYDIYHMQVMEGDLSRTIEDNLRRIAHMQLADTPGRHEPGTGEINFDFLLPHIDRLGYDGWIGCEYRPAGRTVDGLGWMAPYAKRADAA